MSRTDGQTTCNLLSALCIASRGKQQKIKQYDTVAPSVAAVVAVAIRDQPVPDLTRSSAVTERIVLPIGRTV